MNSVAVLRPKRTKRYFKLNMEKILCYLPVPIILLFVFASTRTNKNLFRRYVYFLNISSALIFVYGIVLVMCFKNYYLGKIEDYPSAYVMYWWFMATVFVVAPIDIIFLTILGKKYLQGSKNKINDRKV